MLAVAQGNAVLVHVHRGQVAAAVGVEDCVLAPPGSADIAAAIDREGAGRVALFDEDEIEGLLDGTGIEVARKISVDAAGVVLYSAPVDRELIRKGIDGDQACAQVQIVEGLADDVHSDQNLAATIASGSFKTAGMVIAPCSMKTLSSVVNSYADTLVARAADVVLKEGRPLILMPRETPLHAGHCKLMLDATQIGATIAPPMPAFYNDPQTIDDLINQAGSRVVIGHRAEHWL